MTVTLVAVVLGEGVPLVPELARRFGLGAVGGAVLVALPSTTVMIVSIPVGRLAAKAGARRMTVLATGVVTASCIGQSVSWLPSIVAGRLACGVAFALVWSAALSWLAQLHALNGRRAGHIGTTVTCGSIGSAIGPSLAGVLAGAGGVALPFLIAGAAGTLTLACLLAVGRLGDGASHGDRAVAAASRPHGGHSRRPPARTTRAAAFSLAMSGAIGGAVQLLVPLSLSRGGHSTGAIGLALSAASVVYVASSAVVVRLGPAATRLTFNAAMTGLAALGLVPALLGASFWLAESVLVLTSIPRAAIGTLAYPLSVIEVADPERRAGVFGYLNALWAAAMVGAPLLAGALVDRVGIRLTYAALFVLAGLGAAWLTAKTAETSSRTGLRIRPGGRKIYEIRKRHRSSDEPQEARRANRR